MARRILSRTEETAIVSCIQQGWRIKDVCKAYDLSHSAVQRVLRRNQVEPPPRRYISDDHLCVVCTYYMKGESSRKVAKRIGVSARTVLDALHRAGQPIRSRILFGTEEQRRIAARYAEGSSTTDLARELGVTYTTVSRVVKRHGQIRPARLFDHDDQAFLVKAYNSGLSTTDIGKIVDACPGTIRRYLIDAGIKLRSHLECHRIWHLNEKVFALPSAEGRYWIGMLMADGWVSQTTGAINLTLKQSDRAHVERFRRFLEADYRIRTITRCDGRQYASLTVHSRRLAADLATFGVVERKSLVASVKYLNMDPDFWRGVVDGDGSVGFHKRGYFSLRLYGAYKLTSQFRAFAATIVKDLRSTVRPCSSIYSIGFCCRPAELVARALYDNASVALARKVRTVRWLLQKKDR